MNKHHDLILNGCDTDSIMVSRADGSVFSLEEQKMLVDELNSLFEEGISWEEDGAFDKVVYLKAKNYILYDGDKIKIRGSSLKDSKKEEAIRNFINEIIDMMIFDRINYTDVYNKYILEALNITNQEQIKKWSSKKTLTNKVYTSERANETKLLDAIKGTDYREADKVWTFFKNDDSQCLAEKFDGDYSQKRLLQKLFKASKVFETVLPVKSLFLDYSLKRNQKFLTSLIHVNVKND